MTRVPRVQAPAGEARLARQSRSGDRAIPVCPQLWTTGRSRFIALHAERGFAPRSINSGTRVSSTRGLVGETGFRPRNELGPAKAGPNKIHRAGCAFVHDSG